MILSTGMANTVLQRAGGTGFCLASVRIPECRRQLRCWAGYGMGSFRQRAIASQPEKNEVEGGGSTPMAEEGSPKNLVVPQEGSPKNLVVLSGISGGVSLKEFPSGKVKATLRLGVMKNSVDRSWFDVTAWGQLARNLQQNTNDGEGLCVTGSLAMSEWTSTAGKALSKLEVVAKSVEVVSEAGPMATAQPLPQQSTQYKPSASDAQLIEEAAWEALFRNPADFYDNRLNKRNPRGPDFVHKQSRKALWMDSYRRPAWVLEKLDNDRNAPIPTAQPN